MENNKVNVKIYGQEYVIAGDATKEDIIRVAAHVDMKMQEISAAAASVGATPQNVAILAAVNITSEYFESMQEMKDLKGLNAQLEKDAQHYVQLWDESKKNFNDYKDEAQSIMLQKDQLMNEIRDKDEEISRLKASSEMSRNEIQNDMDEMIKEVEAKCRELENSFFDLQMENLQLKKELEQYKNGIGKF